MKGKIKFYPALFGAIFLLAFSACKKESNEESMISFDPQKDSEEADGNFPYRWLSTYGFFEGDLKNLSPIEGLIPYEPASSLFTDYAHKSRFVWIPEGEKAKISGDELDLPEGSVLVKNFYYPEDFSKPTGERRIIETRLMIHQANGWEAFPYIWNDSQTDAILKVVGGETKVTYRDEKGKDQVINYLIPNKNQCKTCHNKNEKLDPLGVEVKHLNSEKKIKGESVNQLAYWANVGKLEGFLGENEHPKIVDYSNESLPLAERAKAYLDINCAHCHREEGPASTSGLFLGFDQTDPLKLGINKTPVAAGNGAGSFQFDIVPGKADESILIHRMKSTEVGVAMPEIGRTTIHKEGVELIRTWINSMDSSPN
ncbi:hypothetical protein E4S40_13110 [Algoriphagus kandeliae]|uniref:Repeat protein (TIGR03806 family) n=1 Tax=Algoriphagus kandeliae TaxID=2562278 RepID=A0A4Y9QQB1_9BACT|nr:SO2930 family diheme c-type cytochrome [Algoriphagus kandeliae]TFV93196.1 hypothetical protein E4S40_13110 [Algoriphagus kandeliae]